jgi:hypothetical protein
MNNFEYLTEQSLKPRHFETSASAWLVDGALAKQAITMIYAPSGAGKSYLALALTKYLMGFMRFGAYIDRESRLDDLARRGVLTLIKQYPNLSYMHRTTMKKSALETLRDISDNAVAKAYDDCLFVFDGIKHFLGDIESDKKAREMMDMIIDIRDCGGTILIMHHSTKSGSNYQGSKELLESCDNVFSAAKLKDIEGKAAIALTPVKMRDAIAEKAFAVALDGTLTLDELDSGLSAVSDEEALLIDQIETVLSERGALNKGDLLEALGRARNGSLGALLDQFDGVYWRSQRGAKNGKIYSLYKLEAGDEKYNLKSDSEELI